MDLFQTTGDVQPKARRNGPKQLLSDFEQIVLLRLILDNPGIYLHDYFCFKIWNCHQSYYHL